MRNPSVTVFTILAALLLAGGCVAAGNQSDTARSGESQSESRSATSAPIVPLRDQAAKDKDKRGNTPPGMDRTGAGPAEGAILDPSGAVTKQPVLRER